MPMPTQTLGVQQKISGHLPCELKITWFVLMYTCRYDRISAIDGLIRFVLKRHAPGATNSNFLSLALTFDLLTQNE